MLHGGQGGAHVGHHGQTVVVAPRVAHAVAGDQHLGLNLFEAVEHRICPHVWRANAPDRAQTGRGQESHHGFGGVGQIRGHAVAGLDALVLQVQGERGDLTL